MVYKLTLPILFAVFVAALNPVTTSAQVLGRRQRAQREACACGQWTCQSCQQRMLHEEAFCPPGAYPPGTVFPAPPVPGEAPPTPEARDPSEQTLTPETPELSLDVPEPDSLDATTTPSAPTPSAADLFGQNLGAGGSAFGSSLLAATTPEMMGDFFGPGALPSIVAETFPINTSNVIDVGGGILAFELDGDSPPNDFFSLAPPTINPDGSSTVDLGAPTDPNDVPQPDGTGFSYLSGSATQGANQQNWVGSYSYGKLILVPSGAYVLGRLKMAENFSPVPRDRFFFNYSLFHNVPLTSNGTTVNRFTPGFEKTFWDQMASIEFRAPFASTLNTNILIDGSPDMNHTEFGNLFIALKAKLIERRSFLISGGLSVTAPTADDTRVLNRRGTEFLRVENESVHVMPFFGGAFVPNRRFFAQGSLQIDIDSNGNSVLSSDGQRLRDIGTLHDMTFLYLDASLGYWLHRNNCGRGITGIAPIAELHFNRSLNAADSVTDGIALVRNPVQEFDNLNALFGLIVGVGQKSRFAVGYATPIGNGADRVFDGELRATFNRLF